jgi:transcriptional regulator with XRE-family HTH domain
MAECDEFLTVDLIANLAAARREKGLTQEALAKLVGVDRQGIHRLENGAASLAVLMLVMRALEFHVVGLAKGQTLVEQLQNRRKAMGLTKQEIARRSGLTPATVARLEAGEGTVAPLLKVLEVIGTKKMARNKPRAIALTPISWGEKDKRFTPPEFLKIIEDVWAEIDLDPCGHPESHVKAKRKIMLQDGGDGLHDEWSGNTVFLNPPFSAAQKWLARADQMWREDKVKMVFGLVPARTDGVYFHEHLVHACDVGFIRGRLQFARGDGERDVANRAPFPLMVCLWGASTQEIEAFTALCPTVWLQRSRAHCDVRDCSEATESSDLLFEEAA